MPARVRVVIFIPAAVSRAWLDTCSEHVRARGYGLAAVCWRLRDVLAMLDQGATVIVVGERDHLLADAEIRVEVVSDPPVLPIPRQHQRAARLRRWAGG